MIISHEHKFIFFKPLKVAGSSIEVALSKFCGPEDIQTGSEYVNEIAEHDYVPKNNTALYHTHTPPALLYKKTGHCWDDYTRVTIVRNPWDLIVSYYWWSFNSPLSVHSTRAKPLETVGHQLWKPMDNDSPDDIRNKFQGYLEQLAFFADTPYGNEGPETVIKWLSKRTQEFYGLSINRVIRFENIQQDFDEFCESIGVQPQPLPRLKSGQRKKKMLYSEYYDDYSTFLVRKEFRPLIERFGYKF
tara:strand:+ start:4306 stop:5040 length:735 start_codon:yes stop_codon:yes gene_type:complete